MLSQHKQREMAYFVSKNKKQIGDVISSINRAKRRNCNQNNSLTTGSIIILNMMGYGSICLQSAIDNGLICKEKFNETKFK